MTRALIVVLVAGLLGCSGGPLQSTGSASTSDSVCVEADPPSAITWTLRIPAVDGGSTPAGGGTDAGTSGCQTTEAPSETHVACGGPAQLQADTGTPTVAWDDGAQLVWNAGDGSSSPPAVATGGQRVWASYADDVHVICPFCGATKTTRIEVRESQGGKLLFLAQDGRDLPDPSGDQLVALFGVTADTRATCSIAGMDVCKPVLSTRHDHLLRTTPPQVIPWAARTTVAAPNGTFDVVWFSSSEKQTGPAQDCTDGFPPGALTGFAASRLAR